jgi:WD40 repeat protein
MLFLTSLGSVGRAQDFPNQVRGILNRIPGPVFCVRFSKNGKWLAAAGGDIVRVWDTKKWEEVATLKAFTLKGISDSMRCVAFSPDGRILAAAGRPSIHFFDTATWKPRQDVPCIFGAPSRLAFSPDGRTLVSCGSGRSIHFWDPDTGKERDSFYWTDSVAVQAV